MISITDGQIFLESNLFYKGIRPAVNVGKSVSRVGGAAQIKAMKQVAGTLKLDLAQFRDLEAFAAFASDLDVASQKQLARGRKLVETLKQPQYTPYKVEDQIMVIYSATNGFMDDVMDGDIGRYEKEFIGFMGQKYRDIPKQIINDKKLSDDIKSQLESVIKEFNAIFQPSEGH